MYCSYCDKLQDIIFETVHWYVVLARDQSYLGRCTVILKRHAESLSELKDKELLDFLQVVKMFEHKVKEAFDATMCNWTCFMNNAYLERPANPHVHWHVRPRYKKTVSFAGKQFIDPEFGHHYDRARKTVLTVEERNEIISILKK